jgi:hypothetical protein
MDEAPDFDEREETRGMRWVPMVGSRVGRRRPTTFGVYGGGRLGSTPTEGMPWDVHG